MATRSSRKNDSQADDAWQRERFIYYSTSSVCKVLLAGALLALVQVAFGQTGEGWEELLDSSAKQDPASSTNSSAAPQTEKVAPEELDVIPVPQQASEPVKTQTEPTDETVSTKRRNGSSRVIDEIVVTAQKREENLQDVPISIQAFSAAQMDAKGVLDLKDLPQITPGLTVTTQVGYTSTFIRGVGSDAFLLADPSVANYIDGVYQPFSNGAVQDFGAVERVEILKGPQGTLFGRNALGGAINVITRSPSLDRTELSVQSSYAKFNTFKGRIYASTPLGDTLAVSGSLVYDNGEDFRKGLSDGKPLSNNKSQAWRAKLLWMPVDWFDLNLTVLKLNDSGPGSNYSVNVAPSRLAQLAGVQPGDPYAGENNEPIFHRLNNQEYYGVAGLHLQGLDVKLLGSYQHVVANADYDFDGSAQPLARFDVVPIQAKVKTSELQFVSNNDSWGASWLKYIVGLYYFHSPAGIQKGVLTSGSLDLAAGRILGQPIPPDLLTQIRALGGPLPSGTFNFVGLLDTDSYSAYSQATISFTDWASLTLGGRYQSEKRTLTESSSALANIDGSTTTIQSYKGLQDTTAAFKPKVSLEFHLFDGTLLYASYQQANKSSVYNAITIYTPPNLVQAENMTAYEVGLKTRLFDDLATFNVAAFQYQIINPQVQFVSLLKGGAVTFENAGSERIRGVEADTLIQLLPSLTDGLVLTLGGAFLDPIYTSFKNGSGFDDNGLLVQNQDFTGNQIVRSPKFSGTTGLSQTFTTPVGPLELSADYYYTSKIYYLAQNKPADEEPAYGTLRAHLSFLVEPWNLRITAFGANLTSTHYNYSRFITDFGTNDASAPLVTYGLRLNYDFGN